MSPGAYIDDIWSHRRPDPAQRGSTVWTVLVAVAFLALATASFAVEHTLTLMPQKPVPVHLHLR